MKKCFSLILLTSFILLFSNSGDSSGHHLTYGLSAKHTYLYASSNSHSALSFGNFEKDVDDDDVSEDGPIEEPSLYTTHRFDRLYCHQIQSCLEGITLQDYSRKLFLGIPIYSSVCNFRI